MPYGFAGNNYRQYREGLPQGRFSVLLAEDEPQTRDLICETLDSNYMVSVVAELEEAISQLRDAHPDIMLIDAESSTIDLSSVLRAIRQDSALRDTPVIILTGSSTEALLDTGVQEGASDFLTKPFSRKELLTRVAVRLEIERLRKKAEQERLRATMILESISDAFFAVNDKWTFTYINRHAEQIIGRDRRAVIGTNLWEECPTLFGREACHELRRGMREGRSVRLEVQDSDSGTWYDLRAAPCAMDEFLIYVRDISTERKAQEDLRLSEEKYRILVEVSPQVIWSSRSDGYITYANQRWLEVTGLTMGETKGDGWTTAVQPGHVERVMSIWREALRTGGIADVEFPIRVAVDGSYRWHHFRGLPVRDDSGEITLWMGVGVDIHDRKMVAQERELLLNTLHDESRKKDEFLAMLAHELRNPLAAVGYAVAVLGTSDDPEDEQWVSEVIQRQVSQLTHLVDDLLDVSRIRNGKIRLRKKRVDLAVVLDQATVAVAPLLVKRRHELLADYDRSGTLIIEADPTRIEQIVVNLLTNAAKYTDSGGRIWLKAHRDNNSIRISVRDTGTGIPPEKLSEMFELFAQSERSVARSDGGLGLGLTIVKNLTELHGGKVNAQSDGPGTGTEFSVSLPAADISSKQQQNRNSGKASHPMARVLVVDDDVDIARGLTRLLKLQGYDVESVHDGRSALEAARRYKPDVILLDIGLPGMNGYEVARTLRMDQAFSDIQIVAISGYGQEDDRRRSKAAGFNHHLVKPVVLEELTSLLVRRARQ